MPEKAPPLRGIRVVDLATPWAELCGRILADLGAEVIKVEPPEGAASRRLGPFGGESDPAPGTSLYWAALGLGKRSVVLDLESEAAREQLRTLAASADVLVESFAPGYLAGIGLGYETLSAANPGLIYTSVSPYGQDGPDALSPASELTIEAAGGLLGLQGDPDRVPVPVGYPQAAFHAGGQAAADSVIALCEREHSGLGQYLDVSAQAAIVWTLMNATGYPPNTGGNPPFTSETRKAPREMFPGFKLPGIWDCADGYFSAGITLPGLGGRTLQAIAGWMKHDGALPEQYQTTNWLNWTADLMGGKLAIADMVAIVDAAQEFFRGKTKAEIQRFALESGSIVGPVYTIPDLVDDPQLRAREYWHEVGGRTHPGPFVKLAETPLETDRPAPALGEDQSLLAEAHRPIARPPSIAVSATRPQPFAGLKVADFAWVGVGPLISKALADHGATVVRVESETRLETLRLVPPYKDGVAGINRTQFFADFNTSKLGLALDLANAEGRAVARKLIDWADVVTDSFTPGTMAKWGLDYATISAGRPDLIMLSTCLRGQTGPEAAYTGFGGQGAMLAGIHSITGWPDRPPAGPWGAYTDFIGPRFGVAAIAAALRHRGLTGRGQQVDLAQGEAGIHFIEPLVLDYTVNHRAAGPPGTRSLNESPHGVFQCLGDERYIAISVTNSAQWQALVQTMKLDRFAAAGFDELDTRRAAADEIEAVIASWCCEHEPFPAAAKLKAAGVPASVVMRPTDLYQDPQLAHRQFFVTLDHAEMGPTPYDGLVTKFSATPGKLKNAAPCLGQDTYKVLTELLGYSDDDIGTLAASGAIT